MRTRDKMLEMLSEYTAVTGTTEDFDGSEGGIWINAENGSCDDNGLPYFEYYSDAMMDDSYTMGVLTTLNEFAEKNGWYFEWYDAGTIMMYPE
tara:strand:+ start:677 stop:955 length:279 start_codon:yes stop_codon:yes gene_type:complete